MKVLMFGWEFPPYATGGLGTACKGLTKALQKQGHEVTFVLPTAKETYVSDGTRVIPAFTSRTTQKGIKYSAYISPEQYNYDIKRVDAPAAKLYGQNLFAEVERYAMAAEQIAGEVEHDVIHAHDWMTYKAGLKARAVSGKPLVVHMHATEFDRTGDNPNQNVYEIEQRGMSEADRVICVSEYTRKQVIARYDIDPEKVRVVHNGVEQDVPVHENMHPFTDNYPIVLFMGRITLQKGPDYFLKAAKKVLKFDPNIRFVIAGSGDMEIRLVHEAAGVGIGHKVLFTGFLQGNDIHRLYRMAKVYVMPSVSEPFGIAPLEALVNGTPVIISKQSGVSEVLTHCLKVDFWDVDELTNKILGVVRHANLGETMAENGRWEVMKQTWDASASKVVSVYNGAAAW